MKKAVIFIISFLLTVWSVSAQELALDEAIQRAARDIEEELPQRALVLVLNLVSPSIAFTNYILEELTDQLVIGRKMAIVDRQNLTAIREEMNFQYSGEVSDESMVSIGRFLGAHYIVSGSLTERGINYRLRFRVISIETARIISSVIIDIKNDTQVARLIGGEQAVQEAEKRQREAEPKTANARNNWLSANFNFFFDTLTTYPLFGGSLNYERMLNPNISLGVNAYTGFGNRSNNYLFGIDAVFHYYPWGKTFFLGTALGCNLIKCWKDAYSNFTAFGIMVTPEIGWKIDFGYAGGFYLQAGILGALFFGSKVHVFSGSEADMDFVGQKGDSVFITVPKVYLGIGYAF